MAYWLDDGFDSWPEVIRAGTSAAGLYVRCGSWISRNTNDGFVPGGVAAMYGSTEWVRKLVDVGLWEIEGSGYRDVRYFEMGNPTAEKVRAKRKADADRKARWRTARDKKRAESMSRRDSTRDDTRDSRRDDTRDSALPFPSPLLKEGKGTHAPASLGAARASPNDNHTHDPPWETEDPTLIAADQARLVAEAEAAEWALQAERDRTASHVAAAKAALNAIRKGAA